MDKTEQIKARAHEIWESEGCPEGREAEHWAQAEAELRDEATAEGPQGAVTLPADGPADSAELLPAPAANGKKRKAGAKAE